MAYTNRTLFEDLFARNGWSPLPDEELVTLLEDYAGFVQTILPLINKTMPTDFRIDQYPLGHFQQRKLDDELDCVPF